MAATTTSALHRPPAPLRLRPGLVQVLDALAAIVAVGLVWALPDRAYRSLLGEDGPIEWLQVAALAVVLVALVRRGLDPAGAAWRRALLLGLAAVTFVVIGEEIAWATRLFDVSVGAVQARNVQNEVTLHNLGGIEGLEKSFLGIAVVGLAVGAWVARKAPGLAVWFVGPALYAVVRVVNEHPITYRFAKLSEVLELVLYAGLARVAAGYARSGRVRTPA